MLCGLLAGVAGWLDLSLAGLASPAFEELLNARSAVLVACGHMDSVSDLQYRSFCGGCTADALVGALPAWASEGSVAGWKLVPLFFHCLATGCVVALALAAGGLRCGAVAMGLVIAAPPIWRTLSLTGWGNHVESAGLSFAALSLLIVAERRPWLICGAGFLAGLSIWYAPIAVHLVPAMAVAVWWMGRLRFVGFFVASVLLGLLPLALFVYARPAAVPELTDLWGSLSWAPLDQQWRWWTEPLRLGRLWPLGDGASSVFGSVAGCAVVCAGIWGAGLAVRDSRLPPVVRVLPLLGLCSMLVVTAVRFDLWSAEPLMMGFDPFAFRYRAPVVLLLIGGAAIAASRSRVVLAVMGLCIAFGGYQRVHLWGEPSAASLREPLPVVGLDADPTVPLGTPPQRNTRRQGRPQDVQAAIEFLDQHRDPLPLCRAIHVGELGRRLGLSDRRRGCSAPSWSGDDTDRAALNSGYALGCR